MSEKIILVCSECLNRNYRTYKTNFSQEQKVKLKKFCAHCQKHQVHHESR